MNTNIRMEWLNVCTVFYSCGAGEVAGVVVCPGYGGCIGLVFDQAVCALVPEACYPRALPLVRGLFLKNSL